MEDKKLNKAELDEAEKKAAAQTEELSDDVLDLALSVLKSLSEGNRMVGLISHVDKLNESIPQKIHVKNGKKGSTVRVETA